jgi:hypothetical protein
VEDAEFTPGRYNVFILGHLAADYLTGVQQKLLADSVRNGAGLMMLGGHNSFGAGGWADTPLADILPVDIRAGDGQNEPEGGIQFTPNEMGLDSYLLQVGATRAETKRIWANLPPILGANHLGEPKRGAVILATTPPPILEPLLVSQDGPGRGRVIAYGGDTWTWATASEEGRLAHRKLWRQVIFWLAHKENEGDNRVSLSIRERRVSVGDKIELTATARDSKGAAIPNVQFETKIERDNTKIPPTPVELLTQGDEAHGSAFAVENLGEPGTYTVTTIARKGSEEVGRDTARFLVYQDDRELENPSADLGLARSIAEITDGEFVTPERVLAHLKGIDQSVYTEYVSPSEYKIWDNWPFLLIFTALLTLEWWLRKRNGWV